MHVGVVGHGVLLPPRPLKVLGRTPVGIPVFGHVLSPLVIRAVAREGSDQEEQAWAIPM